MDRTNFTTVESLEEQGFLGMDVNLATSILEYGIIYKDMGDYWELIIGVNTNTYGVYTSFSYESITKEDYTRFINGEETLSSKDIDKLLDYMDVSLDDVQELNVSTLYSIIQYWGSHILFGDIIPMNNRIVEESILDQIDELEEDIEKAETEVIFAKDKVTDLNDDLSNLLGEIQ